MLDASVAVAALRPNERNHAAARAYVSPLLLGVDETIVPAIFRVELGSALARAGFATAEVERFVDGFLDRATTVTIGPERARGAQRVATATRLRAADAIYVWLAVREGIPLVTLDAEIAKLAPATCQVVIP